MLPSRHIIASIPVSIAIWAFSQSWLAGLLCFSFGVLIDFDHILEYIIHYGFRKTNVQQVYRQWVQIVHLEKGGFKKLYLIFHVGEFAILFWVIFALTRNIYVFSIALGYTLHLVMDSTNKLMKPNAYFITIRIKNAFSTEKLTSF